VLLKNREQPPGLYMQHDATRYWCWITLWSTKLLTSLVWSSGKRSSNKKLREELHEFLL